MSKSKRSQIGKKKQIRNILILAAVVIVIAAAIFLYIALQKDGAGMNCFQRNATAASANSVRASMAEYRIAFDSTVSNSYTTNYSDAEIRTLQENAAKSVLLQKVYRNQAKKLGLSLTDEQTAKCRESAQAQVDSIEAYLAQYLNQQGNYSKSALENQLTSYYQQLGMSKTEYYELLKNSMEADYYRQAIEAYYAGSEEKIDEAELAAFYRKTVEKLMYTTGEDGTKTATYSDGDFWNTLLYYQYGLTSAPMLYVPEGFIYIDFIRIEADSAADAVKIVTEVTEGERSFDELMNSDENKDPFKTLLRAPYPISEHDHSALFTSDEVYNLAAALEVGEIGWFYEEPKTSEDGTTTATAYLFRRAKGTMCMDGETGIIDINYFPDIHYLMENEYRLDKWLGEIRYEDAMYAYKGALG